MTGRKLLNHQIYYNGKIVDMGYVLNPKEQFKLGAMRISDNLGTDKKIKETEGYIKTPNGKIYKVNSSSKSAKLLSGEELETAAIKFEASADMNMDMYGGDEEIRFKSTIMVRTTGRKSLNPQNAPIVTRQDVQVLAGELELKIRRLGQGMWQWWNKKEWHNLGQTNFLAWEKMREWKVESGVEEEDDYNELEKVTPEQGAYIAIKDFSE